MEIDEIRKWFESEDGKASLEKSRLENERRKAHEERWIEKFKKLAEPDMDAALEKLISKYNSDKYVQKEYDLGYEPREDLLWVAFDYAIKYCKECDDDKYLNDFTGAAYYIGSYVIQVMHGQGSVIRIDKIRGKIKPSKKEATISQIENRILTEYKKHAKNLPDDWAKIAAAKIYSTLSEKYGFK
jgi:hypothetical protein